MAKKFTDNIFRNKVKEIYGEEYEVIGKYTGNKNNIEIKHNVCGKSYFPKPNDFLRGKSTCYHCSEKRKRTTDDFKEEVYNLVKNEYEVLEEYKNAHSSILMKHNKCGNIFPTSRNTFLKGHRCPICSIESGSEKRRFTFEYILNFIKEKGYEYISGEYKNATSELYVKCQNGHIFKTSYLILYGNHGCPICSKSRGEMKISNFLINYMITFEKRICF